MIRTRIRDHPGGPNRAGEPADFLAAPAPEFFFQAAPDPDFSQAAPGPGTFFGAAPAPRGQIKPAPAPDYRLSLAKYSFPHKLVR